MLTKINHSYVFLITKSFKVSCYQPAKIPVDLLFIQITKESNWNTSSILCRPLPLSSVEILTGIKETDLDHLNVFGLVFAAKYNVSAVNLFLDFYLCSFSHLLAGCTLLDMNTESSLLCFCRWNCKVSGTHCIHSDLEEAKPDTSVLITKICNMFFKMLRRYQKEIENPKAF